MKKGIITKVIFVLLVVLLSFNLYAGTTNGLVSYFKFNGDYTDSSGNNTEFKYLINTDIVDNSLYLNGIYNIGNPDGYKVIIPIKDFNYETFSFSLDFYVLKDKNLPIYNIITGGRSYRWLAFSMDKNGKLFIKLNNRLYKNLNWHVSLEEWHNLKCSFDLSQKKIIVIFDDNTETINLESDFKFDVVGSKFENSDKHFTFTDYSNGDVFYGYVDNLMIYNSALTLKELQQLNDCNETVAATYNSDSKLIHIPCFVLGNSSYWLDLKIIKNNPVKLELTNYGVNKAGACNDTKAAIYNSSSSILDIPCFVLGNSSYWLNMKVINTSPLQFEVTNFGVNR